jgi:hypothetical protein
MALSYTNNNNNNQGLICELILILGDISYKLLDSHLVILAIFSS